MSEPVLDPDLPIIDPHHHLWDRRARVAQAPMPTHGFQQILFAAARYMFDDLLADMTAGHNVRATVYLECGSHYRADGPAELKPVGETEFVNGVAAMGASGEYGPVRPCAAIIGHADLTRGAAVGAVLDAHMAASARFRGIRHSCSYDADPAVLGPLNRHTAPHLYAQPKFREGFAELGKRGLSFDAWLLEPQLPDVIDLARAFPDTAIVLDHVGTPLGLGGYAGRQQERFPVWRDSIRELAKSPNVSMKLGGLAMPFPGLPSFMASPRFSSEQLAAEWKPYIETCIEAFGADRCMFESNFPVDSLACDYRTLWNAFKRLAAGASAAEKTALFSGTAARVYRIAV